MYDTIHCLYPLPGVGPDIDVFQTKDFYKDLDLYEITREGRLLLKRWGRREEPVIPEGGIDISFHGDVTFYTDDNDLLGDLDFIETGARRPTRPMPRWIEFTARFTRGQLEGVNASPPCPKCGRTTMRVHWQRYLCWECDIKANFDREEAKPL